MAKSTRLPLSRKPAKPAKPYPDFPLFPHASGRWAKKIRGRTHFFGRWGRVKDGKLCPVDDQKAEAQKAVDLYNEQRDDLHAGRKPRKRGDEAGLTIKALCNAFWVEKRNRMRAGEITARTFGEYYKTTDRITEAFGLTRLVEDLAADDFESLRAKLAKTRGPVALGNEIQRIRTVFKFAFDNALIEKPIRYGTAFDKPSAKSVRKARAAHGSQMFEPAELQALIGTAEGQLKAMILLAVNCAFGAADLSSLPKSAINLKTGWLDFARVKTGVERRCPLWPETVEALRVALANRPEPHNETDVGLVFLTPKGKRWVQLSQSDDPKKWTSRRDWVSYEFERVMKAKGINGGRGFYCCRRTFQTVAENTGDFPAVSHVIGHAPRMTDMSATYRQRISDERLKAVTEAVRTWLYAKPADGAEAETEGGAA